MNPSSQEKHRHTICLSTENVTKKLHFCKKYFSKKTSKTGLFRAEIKRRKLVSALLNKRSEKGGNRAEIVYAISRDFMCENVMVKKIL